MKCKNCGHDILGHTYNFGCGELKKYYTHKVGGNYCKVVSGDIMKAVDLRCLCNKAEPEEKNKG